MNAGKSISDSESYFNRHVYFASSLLASFNGDEPFHLYLKKYFAKNKKHGSRDRREISSLCYDYFRLGCAFRADIPLEKRILIAKFLFCQHSSEILERLMPEWNALAHKSLDEKAGLLQGVVDLTAIFPFKEEVSPQINVEIFNRSFLAQPKVYVRVRPGKFRTVTEKLNAGKAVYEILDKNAISFDSATRIGDLLKVNREVVIQDVNSQRTGEFLTVLKGRKYAMVWDCCAASGGKSILAVDLLDSPQLTVSDSRSGILKNLYSRFKEAGIQDYHALVADLTKESPFANALFDLIIADVPCSGSGTWARSPEQLQYFKLKKINEYSRVQKEIAGNAMNSLKPGGYFLYITCSVFYAENEQNVEWLKERGLRVIRQKYFRGYKSRADTLFGALLKLEE